MKYIFSTNIKIKINLFIIDIGSNDSAYTFLKIKLQSFRIVRLICLKGSKKKLKLNQFFNYSF